MRFFRVVTSQIGGTDLLPASKLSHDAVHRLVLLVVVVEDLADEVLILARALVAHHVVQRLPVVLFLFVQVLHEFLIHVILNASRELLADGLAHVSAADLVQWDTLRDGGVHFRG